MISSGERLFRALKAGLDAENEDELHAAASRFVRAEREHLDKLGVLTTSRPTLARILPLTLVVTLVITLFLVIHNAAEINSTAAKTSYDIRLTQRQSCARTNPQIVARVETLLLNDSEARTLAALAPPKIGAVLDDYAMRFHRQAELIVDSQVSVAAHPNAKRLADRAAVDCAAVYPVSAQRGESLPDPRLP